MRHIILLLFIYLSVIQVACAKHVTVYQEPEFISYIESFEAVTGLSVNVEMRFVDSIRYVAPGVSGQSVALCSLRSREPARIVVLRQTWESYDDAKREYLIWHELGHCMLNHRGHNDTMINGIPASIMGTYTLNGQIFAANKTHYTNDLKRLVNMYRVMGYSY